MNPLIKRVLGEADTASETERAVLDREIQSGPTTDHGEADAGNPEESQEIQLAQQILAAVKSGDKQTVIQAASELIRMHDPATKASYEQQRANQPTEVQQAMGL